MRLTGADQKQRKQGSNKRNVQQLQSTKTWKSKYFGPSTLESNWEVEKRRSQWREKRAEPNRLQSTTLPKDWQSGKISKKCTHYLWWPRKDTKASAFHYQCWPNEHPVKRLGESQDTLTWKPSSTAHIASQTISRLSDRATVTAKKIYDCSSWTVSAARLCNPLNVQVHSSNSEIVSKVHHKVSQTRALGLSSRKDQQGRTSSKTLQVRWLSSNPCGPLLPQLPAFQAFFQDFLSW